ncbi:type II toxin-antitoxin system death-on-curing family toxin [Halobacteriales archaeon QS_1_68_20]|nr:MAG: type II toxin-antitoxin system death-on-curing family toxin [Halobacteriales archaeon QS_1_68_20]
MTDETDDGASDLFDGVERAESDIVGDDDEFWYPTVEDIVEIHDAIIAEDPEGEPGIEDRDRIQYAVDYVQHGMFGEKPETVHEKAFALVRLLASNHWFVDGNKRTALNTTNLFYILNGYELEYGQDLRAMLKLLAVREDIIDRDVATGYLAEQTEELAPATMWTIGIVAIAETLFEELGIEPADFDIETDSDDTGSDPDDHND